MPAVPGRPGLFFLERFVSVRLGGLGTLLGKQIVAQNYLDVDTVSQLGGRLRAQLRLPRELLPAVRLAPPG